MNKIQIDDVSKLRITRIRYNDFYSGFIVYFDYGKDHYFLKYDGCGDPTRLFKRELNGCGTVVKADGINACFKNFKYFFPEYKSGMSYKQISMYAFAYKLCKAGFAETINQDLQITLSVGERLCQIARSDIENCRKRIREKEEIIMEWS